MFKIIVDFGTNHVWFSVDSADEVEKYITTLRERDKFVHIDFPNELSYDINTEKINFIKVEKILKKGGNWF